MRILKRRAEPRLTNAGYSSQIVADNFPTLKQTMMALQNIMPRV